MFHTSHFINQPILRLINLDQTITQNFFYFVKTNHVITIHLPMPHGRRWTGQF